jgi:hypothetical protein
MVESSLLTYSSACSLIFFYGLVYTDLPLVRETGEVDIDHPGDLLLKVCFKYPSENEHGNEKPEEVEMKIKHLVKCHIRVTWFGDIDHPIDASWFMPSTFSILSAKRFLKSSTERDMVW